MSGARDRDVGLAEVILNDLRELLTDLHSSHLALIPSASALRRDLKLAVRHFLGCVIVTGTDVGAPLVFTLVDDTLDLADVHTSLELALLIPPSGADDAEQRWQAARDTPPAVSRSTAASLTFYSGQPGALVELAADFLAVLDIDSTQLTIDAPLPPGTLTAGLAGLERFNAVHQAVGVLIAQGLTPTTARAQLNSAADPHATAITILQAVR